MRYVPHLFGVVPLQVWAAMSGLLIGSACPAVEPLFQGRLDADPTYTAYHFAEDQIAVSDGTVLVGDVGVYRSAAHVFGWGPGGWSREGHFGPPPEQASDFGQSLDLSGDWAVAGDLYDHTYGQSSGAAYIYRRTPGGWEQYSRLPSPGLTDYSNFGRSVGIHGEWAVVGCPGDATAGDSVGAAYVYTNSAGQWQLVSKLIPPDAEWGATFGWTLGISGDTLVVGTTYYIANHFDDYHRGAAYVYELDENADWSLAAKLQGHALPAHLQKDGYASDIDIDGDLIIVGAPDDSLAQWNAGAAYIYRRAEDGWQEQAALTPHDLGPLNEFGQQVAISEEYGLAAIGGLTDYDSGYFFELGAGGWAESSGFEDELGIWPFARDIDIDGSTLAVASTTSGDTHVRMYAIPEPGGISLLAAVGLAMIRRRSLQPV